jgi:serine/threonine-protein kinase
LIDGRYEVLERLGAGGMGTVFKARDCDLDLSVAVKVVRLGEHGQSTARFKSEIKLARRVKHRNVCALWQNGYEGNVAFIVMEFVEGRTLRELVRGEGPLAWEHVCDLALQAAEGLQAIHEVGVVHRDVKASNLMVDARGVVRVVDFGIAKGVRSAAGQEFTTSGRITDKDQVVGSPEYMSPEQVRGAPVDARSDIYSFGIVLYELFTGRVPFRGENALATMVMHLEEPPVLDGPEAATLPPQILPILRRALAKAPADRHPGMRALIADLRKARTAIAGSSTESRGSWRAESSLWQRVALGWLPGGIAVGLIAYAISSRSTGPAPPPATPGPTTTLPAPTTVSSPPVVANVMPLPLPTPTPSPSPPEQSRQPRPVSPRPAATRTPSDVLAPAAASPQVSAPPPTSVEPAREPPPQTPSPTATPVTTLVATPGPTPVTTVSLAPAPGQLYSEGDPEVVKAECQSCPTDYPPVLERLRLEGDVEVQLLVDENGRVTDARVTGASRRELKDAAVQAVRKWRFRPATKQGVPGKLWRTVTVKFRLLDAR